MNVVQKAKDLALEKHHGLCRPSASAQPLTEHLEEVASLATKADMNDNAVASAWLHDIVEDTDKVLEDIRGLFGDDIAGMVDDLTDPPDFILMDLKQRKMAQAERLAKKDADIKIIKLCDQISNVRSVLYDPPTDWLFEKSWDYIKGAKRLADVARGLKPELDREFDALYTMAREKYGDGK